MSEDKLNKRIVELVKKKEWQELADLLLNTEDVWVLQIMNGWVRHAECPQWVGGVVSALSCSTRESTTLRLEIFKYVLKCVRERGCVSERCAGELMGMLMVHVGTFPASALVSLISDYMELIKGGEPLLGRWLDLFPKLITCISTHEEVTIGGKQLVGEDYRYQVIKTLCDMPWYPETPTRLIPIFSDMNLPEEELEDVVFKVECVLKDMEYQAVPPIMYQLITLACSKLPSRIIGLILNYFMQQESKLTKEKDKRTNDVDMDDVIGDSKERDLAEAKGTVILHVTHFATYNTTLVKDYVKFIKSSTWLGEQLITPFNLALSLSLSNIERYEDMIMSALKTCLVRAFREERLGRTSRWVRDAWGSDCDVNTTFRTTVDSCVMGWDQVSEGLVQLSFKLLEYSRGMTIESYSSQRARQLAMTTIPRIVKKQPHLTHTVLTNLCNFILSSSLPNMYIEMLGRLAKMVPLSLLDNLTVIRGPLEYLDLLPPTTASLILDAYTPLFRINMALKDSVIIRLRKLLFSSKAESRHVAVSGFLQLLRNFRLLGTLPSSQASMSFCSSLNSTVTADVHTSLNSSTNESLCQEMLGLLRRCFSQQQEIRLLLYQGLHDVCQANPNLGVNILEMLYQHLRRFLDLRTGILNPVVLKKVFVVRGDSVILVEPVGDALSCLAACKNCYEKRREARNEDDDDDAIEVLNEVCSAFDVLTERLSGCDLEDLGINPNGDFTNESRSGQKNLLSCQIMIRVFDSLMEHTFINSVQDSNEVMQTVISCFRSQRKIVDLVKERSAWQSKIGDGSKGKGKSPDKAAVTVKSNLSLRVATDMLAASVGPDSDAGSALRNNHEFQMYLFTTIEEHVLAVKRLSNSEKEKILSHLKTIAKVLLHECVEKLGVGGPTGERDRAWFKHSLQILHSLMINFTEFYKDKLEAVMKEILGKTDNRKLDTLLYKFAKRCQKMLLRILQIGENYPLMKDAMILLQIMTTVTQAMDPNCAELGEVQDWIHQLCKDHDPDHVEIAKSLMTLLIKLSNQFKGNHNLTRVVARELHHKFGDFEQDVEVEESNKYKVVSERTASAVLTCILDHFGDTLTLIELVINKMRACVASGTEFDANEVEKSISIKLTILMSGAHEIMQSALQDGPTIDHNLRIIIKLYSVLSLYVKYYIELYKVKNNTQISDKFEKVVYTSAEAISKPVYPMITYIESTQRAVGNKKRSKPTVRAMREAKFIPSLIYSLEQYEKHLITLAKKSKVNLMEGMKLGTARDFRIMSNALQDVLNEEEEEEHEEENRVDDDGDRDTDESSNQEENDDNVSRPEEPAKSQAKTVFKRKSQGKEEEGKSAGKTHKSREEEAEGKGTGKKHKSREEEDSENEEGKGAGKKRKSREEAEEKDTGKKHKSQDEKDSENNLNFHKTLSASTSKKRKMSQPKSKLSRKRSIMKKHKAQEEEG